VNTFPNKPHYNEFYVQDGYERKNTYEDKCYIVAPETKDYNKELLVLEKLELLQKVFTSKYKKRWHTGS